MLPASASFFAYEPMLRLLQSDQNKGCMQNRAGTACRLCHRFGANTELLLAAVGGQLPGKAVMLQASASFFAYEPILRALQSNQNMPLAHYIANPSIRASTAASAGADDALLRISSAATARPEDPFAAFVRRGIAGLSGGLFGKKASPGELPIEQDASRGILQSTSSHVCLFVTEVQHCRQGQAKAMMLTCLRLATCDHGSPCSLCSKQHCNYGGASTISRPFAYADDGSDISGPEAIAVAPPAYQTEAGRFTLDLSCLVSTEEHNEDALSAIKAIDVHAGQWPSAALQQLTSLDQSQLLALKVMHALEYSTR